MSEAARSSDAIFADASSFPPDPAFTAQANARDLEIYDRAAADPEAFWASFAEELDWIQKWNKVLEWNPPHAKWFVDGKINLSYNCVDRHAAGSRRDKAAIIFEGEPGDVRTITYGELHTEVCKFANVLKGLGIKKGDRVAIYMPMIPELPIAMLACARLGAPHSVVFGGFSTESLRERILDSGAKLLVTADGGWRRGNVVQLKKVSDEALQGCPDVTKMVVVERIGAEKCPVTMAPGRDIWWHDAMASASPVSEPEICDAEDTLFILYTSGSTGKPKGIQHTSAGYLTGVYATTKLTFDLKDDDIFWCTADVGWVTGHSYVVYGPLANGATVVMYEGSPDTPNRDRFWRIIEKHRVTILYTAPTAIRTFMKWGDDLPKACDLSSLRLMGSVGEPINPEAWLWYHNVIGGGKLPIVDTWWQTETGQIMITPLPGLVATKPGSATRPFPGISAEVVNEAGEPMPIGEKGYLVLTKPWPGMLRTLWGDDMRYRQVYWSRFAGRYLTGDGAAKDADGYFWLMGRMDDIMLVAGHNISTMELESALVEHAAVAEAAVIGKAHDLKGQSPVAFVIVREGYVGDDALATELKKFVGAKLGPVCRPDDIIFTGDLPKTRSGKIMRRLLRDIAEGRVLGDTTTLADPHVVASLKDKYT
ncbi:MAG: acetate--CoA ligase, partial [Chthonomonadales bacterium]|nr:acetate--CoA ligase [Chthonomonadales bacterium]